MKPLPPYRPRSFVPAQIDLGDWAQIAPLFAQLERRQPHTVDELEKLVARQSAQLADKPFRQRSDYATLKELRAHLAAGRALLD